MYLFHCRIHQLWLLYTISAWYYCLSPEVSIGQLGYGELAPRHFIFTGARRKESKFMYVSTDNLRKKCATSVG